MPRLRQRKRQKQEIESVIAEILIGDPSASFRDVDYKLRSDPVWRKRLSGIQKLPTIGTIKNYVSAIRAKLRSSGSDRPWSILASANSQNVNYISATDLPLILKIWRIRLAQGSQLTLRQAKWISRLRNIRLWDLETDTGLSSLFQVAARYAGRQAALGGNASTDSFDSYDLDGDLAFGGNIDEFDDLNTNEKAGLRVMYQAAIDTGQLLPLSGDPILTRFVESSANPYLTRDTLWRTDESMKILGEIEDLIGRRISLKSMSLLQQAGLFGVMRAVLQKPEWSTRKFESKRSLVERIVDAVTVEDWKSIADMADMKVWGVNHDWSNYLKGMINESEPGQREGNANDFDNEQEQ